MHYFVRPRNGHVLVPPPPGYVSHVEAQHEAQRYKIDERVAPKDDLLEDPPLVGVEGVPVEDGDGDEEGEEQEQLPVDELVERTPPHEEEPREAAAGGTGDLILIGHRHPSEAVVLQDRVRSSCDSLLAPRDDRVLRSKLLSAPTPHRRTRAFRREEPFRIESFRQNYNRSFQTHDL